MIKSARCKTYPIKASGSNRRRVRGDSLGEERVDRGIRIARLAQHLAAVLAQARRVAPVLGRSFGPLGGRAHRSQLAFARMIDAGEVAGCGEMRIGEGVSEAVHTQHRDAGALRRLEPLRGPAVVHLRRPESLYLVHMPAASV